MNDLVQNITSMSTELESLQQKSLADDNLIGVLKERIKQLSAENERMRNGHAMEMSRVKHERDTAFQMVEEVQGIITAIGNQALKGIERMRPHAELVETSTVHVGDERIPQVLYEQGPPEEPLQLMKPVEGSVEQEVEEAIRPFIRRAAAHGN